MAPSWTQGDHGRDLEKYHREKQIVRYLFLVHASRDLCVGQTVFHQRINFALEIGGKALIRDLLPGQHDR